MTRLEALLNVRDEFIKSLPDYEPRRGDIPTIALLEIAIGLEYINAQLTNIGFELSGINR